MTQEFFLETSAQKKAFYLSQLQIDLLFIVSCTSKNQLESFFHNGCGQFPNQQIEDVIHNYHELDVEQAKRALFQKYQDTLMDNQTQVRATDKERLAHKLRLMRTKDGKEIPPEVIDVAYETLTKDGLDACYRFIKDKYSSDTEFITKLNRITHDDFENIKAASYEDILLLHERIKNDSSIDTITIATGKYDNSVYRTGNNNVFDAFHTAKGLTYCRMMGKHMRYHALFDYAHIKNLLAAKKGPQNKREILDDIKEFIKESFEFIEKYNASVVGTNIPTINVVEVFNELVEYNKEDKTTPYEMAWEKYFDITIPDILSCFDGVTIPKGVELMYNETQLEESPERIKKVEEVFQEIMRLRPDLIDVFGNQMHLKHTHADPNTTKPEIGPQAVEQGLDLMQRIQNGTYQLPNGTTKKVRTEITEFDIHICKETYLERVLPMLKDGSYTIELLIDQRHEWFKFISSLIQKRNLDIERIGYWSLLDKVDHNLVRANESIINAEENQGKTLEELRSEGKLVDTLYAGALGNGATPLPTYEIPVSKPVIEQQSQESQPQEPVPEEKTTEEPTLSNQEQPTDTLDNNKPKALKFTPNFKIPNSGYISEYIILLVIISVLLTLVMLTIFSIT